MYFYRNKYFLSLAMLFLVVGCQQGPEPQSELSYEIVSNEELEAVGDVRITFQSSLAPLCIVNIDVQRLEYLFTGKHLEDISIGDPEGPLDISTFEPLRVVTDRGLDVYFAQGDYGTESFRDRSIIIQYIECEELFSGREPRFTSIEVSIP